MSAFVFVPLLVLTWILGLAVVAHAGQYFLSIVESSSTGMAQNVAVRGRSFREWVKDGIDWPDEPFADYLLKGFFLSYLAVLWAGPAVVVGRLATDEPGPRLAIAAGLFWLGFPIGVLSSLASGSRWNPFWPGLFVGLARRPLQTLGFYLTSAPLLAVLFVLFDLVLLRPSQIALAWVVALAPVGVLALFVYARLVGRLGLSLSYSLPDAEEPEPRPAKRKRKPRRPAKAYDEKHRWGIPTEEFVEETPKLVNPYDDEEVTAYGVAPAGVPAPEEPPKPAPVVHTFEDEDDTPLVMEPAADLSQTDRAAVAAELANPPEHEVALYLTSRPTEPANPYGAGSLTFLFDMKTVQAWLTLTAGVVLLALGQRALDALRPS
ncbi:MAG TPA: hypothetical protein VM597_34255 [Gemmataceae bacterium]|jgi:hypothetical protein|nr:hypothetical protein [Gemmataceae bacterium]